jgi:hypothetical protein
VKKIKHPLYNAMRLYGWEAFEKSVVWRGPVSLLNEKEEFYIAKLDTFIDNGHGYNLTTGGCGGMQFSKRSLKLLSKKQKAVWADPDYRAKKTVLFASKEFRDSVSAACKERFKDPVKKAAHLEEVRSPRRRSLVSKQSKSMWATKRELLMSKFESPEFVAKCSEASKRGWAARSAEDRAALSAKIWETRRANAAKKLAAK